jgi:hypothetical protein
MTDVIKKATVSHGERLPCRRSQVFYVERRKAGLELWYTEELER